ncbi:hypothetical protein C9374_000276 [Naegleria lovaniensis]|uniref:Uncharacterized protein n=1 Tax=Naegleria lovaniensis TaxID=51637 RepID=A0AA88GTY7_NAELO|nr:uncharacterized protein C9374_000276 [Naegleria lovaniensis]KAG2388837.1 hypothetical protein C9374_000276 [Naegleria lovaniensis]
MTRHSLQDVIKEQHQKAASAPPLPKQGWFARMLYADKSAKGWSPTRQLSVFVPTLFVCMMATTLVMKSKLSVKFEDIDEESKKKCEVHRKTVNELFREKREKDMDEVLLDYEVRLWSNGYQNKPVPRSIENTFNDDDDDAGDD